MAMSRDWFIRVYFPKWSEETPFEDLDARWHEAIWDRIRIGDVGEEALEWLGPWYDQEEPETLRDLGDPED